MANKRTEGITIPVSVDLNAKLDNLENSLKRAFSDIDKLDIGKGIANSLNKRQTNLQNAISQAKVLAGKDSLTGNEVKELEKLQQTISKELLALEGINKQIVNSEKTQIKDLVQPYEELSKKLSEVTKLYEKFQGVQAKIKTTSANVSDLKKEREQFKTRIDTGTASDADVKAYESLTKRINELTLSLSTLRQQRTQLAKDIIDTSGLEDIKPTIQGVTDAVDTLTSQTETAKRNVQNVGPILDQVNNELQESGQSAREFGQGVGQASESVEQLTDQQQEIQNLTNRFKQFFSLTSAITLFRRAIHDAVEEIKVLDKAMTATAVVSTETVSSMWSHLPEYTEQASKLGVAIEDVVSAQTLFVQQGLDLNTSLDLAVETLKMARIAGIDAADATSYMTAALRGFNMELSETSAQRINDVYSELAKITASDTREISVAMTKVASIANSANMSFENTAAFLAQIVNIMATYNRNIVRIIPNMRETPQSLNYFRG